MLKTKHDSINFIRTYVLFVKTTILQMIDLYSVYHYYLVDMHGD